MYFRDMKSHPTIRCGPLQWLCCLALAGPVLCSGMACAGDTGSGPSPAKAQKQKVPKDAPVMITGSTIPQPAATLKRIPITTSPMIILGRSELDRSGQSTVADVLRRLPVVR